MCKRGAARVQYEKYIDWALTKPLINNVKTRVRRCYSADTAQHSTLMCLHASVLPPQQVKIDAQTETKAQCQLVFVGLGSDGPTSVVWPFSRPRTAVLNAIFGHRPL